MNHLNNNAASCTHDSPVVMEPGSHTASLVSSDFQPKADAPLPPSPTVFPAPGGRRGGGRSVDNRSGTRTNGTASGAEKTVTADDPNECTHFNNSTPGLKEFIPTFLKKQHKLKDAAPEETSVDEDTAPKETLAGELRRRYNAVPASVRQQLLDTRGTLLYDDGMRSMKYGTGLRTGKEAIGRKGKKTGRNLLGRALTAVRDEIKKEDESKRSPKEDTQDMGGSHLESLAEE